MAPGTDRRSGRDTEFTEYYAARGTAMRATAYLMCGDWHLAEDLVQTAFTKLYLAWHRVERHGQLDRYVRQIVTRSFLDDRRRPWRRERPTDRAGEVAGVADRPVADPAVEDRMVLAEALAGLPSRQRATLVLRFWEDLSVDETAQLLGVSPGTVKSQTAHGLERLRDRLGLQLTALELENTE